MNFNNINKLKDELITIRLRKDTSNNYTLFEYSDRNPEKFRFEPIVQNAISDLYSLTDEKKQNVLNDFWDLEGEFFSYYEIARRVQIYAHSKPIDTTNILLLYKDFLKPRIDINSKNFDRYFLAELKETFLERRGKICGFITLIKNKFFENKYIDFLATPKKEKHIGHFIKEIEEKKALPNEFCIKQVETDKPQEKKRILSVAGWSIVFYYLHEAGEFKNLKKSKIKLRESFIKKHNIINDKGIITTELSFKKEYYLAGYRINGKKNNHGELEFSESYPPLNPDKIENILPFLKKNRIAMQTAKDDIKRLSTEVEMYRDNKEKYY